MRIGDFDLYKDLLARTSGLTLSPDKCYLLDSRLTPIAKKRGFATLDAMTLALRGIQDPGLVKDVVEAMTINETSFFRDRALFDALREEIIPHVLKKRGKKTLRIWCAACSSGQEAYSVALLLREMKAQMKGWDIGVLASDISDSVLEQAQSGLYSQFEVQRGLPIRMLIKYFEQSTDQWQLQEDVRDMVTFQQFNLLQPMDEFQTFDIILCRNVLSYFEEPTKTDVLNRIAAQLTPEGFLLTGISETLTSGPFKMADSRAGLYVLQDSDYNKGSNKAAR